MRLRETFEEQAALTAVLCASIALTTSCANPARESSSPAVPAGSISKEEGANNTPRVDINSASISELEKLPGIGQSLAQRIVEHRARYGPFRRPEHLIIVRGISERRYKMLHSFITAE